MTASRLVIPVFYRSVCMNRFSLAISVTFCALLATPLTSPPRAGAQENPPGGKKAASKDVVKQWADLLARREKLMDSLEGLQERYQSADLEGKRKIEAEFRKLQGDFLKEIEPEMAKIAPAVLEKDPTDAIAAQFVIGKAIDSQKYAAAVATLNKLIKSGSAKPNLIEQVLGMLLTENRFADVIEVADKLVEGKDVNPRLLVIDSLAHFYADDFERAKELSQRAKELDPAADPNSEGFAKNCDEQAALWKKEQQIRAKEAKADDLPRVQLK